MYLRREFPSAIPTWKTIPILVISAVCNILYGFEEHIGIFQWPFHQSRSV